MHKLRHICFMDECKVHTLTNKPSKSSSKLVLGNCVGKRFALGVALRYESCKTVKVSSFGCKQPLGVFLQKSFKLIKWRD